MRGVFLLLVCVAVAVSAEKATKKGSAYTMLMGAVDTIETRLRDTQSDADTHIAAVNQNCTMTNNTINDMIKGKTKEINDKQKEIDTTQLRIDSLGAAIIEAQNAKAAAEKEKGQKEKAIVDGDAQREAEQKQYVQNDKDTDVALEAIADIKTTIAGSTLGKNEDDTKEDYTDHTLENEKVEALDNATFGEEAIDTQVKKGGTYDAEGNYQAQATLLAVSSLRKVASKMQDATARSFVEMAALSASALGGDVSKLNALLDKLDKELVKYKAELKADEEQAVEDWRKLRGDLVARVAELVTEIALQKSNIERDSALKLKAEELKVTLEAEKAAFEKEKRDMEAQQAALTKMCKDENDDYNADTARREKEHATLVNIKKAIDEHKDKLGYSESEGALSGEVGYRWKQGEWGPCENNVKTAGLKCIHSESGEEVTEDPHLKCGTAPEPAQAYCRSRAPDEQALIEAAARAAGY